MKVSIITVVYNNKDTILDAIDSVLNQNYDDIEYIIIDGNSTDGTIDIIKSYGNKISQFISEPDSGIYDAMNKGIRLATGDVVGILNSDDFYIDDKVIGRVVGEFEEKGVDSLFADLVYVKPDNLKKYVRRYSSKSFKPSKFAYGWMPAHPTFFVKKEFYDKHGLYKTDYQIASDYELLIRFLHKYKLSYSYIDAVLTVMRMGGASTSGLKSNWILNKEILRGCRENGIRTSLVKIYSKYPKKILELIKK
ncbi:MAG: glycosyltransferase family 2 protein [Campylobacterota bacterium]|nr:glycosyltransferase family 2 protein [Campylobacterota bacterium]